MLKFSPPPAHELRLALGEALRSRRKELGLSMQRVADRADLSVGFVSQVERGLTAPSLASLVSIAAVLEAPLSRFLEQPHRVEPLTRRGGRQPYGVPGAAMTYERLSTVFSGSKLHSVVMRVPPGGSLEPAGHTGEELHYVLSGSVTIEIDGVGEILSRGDSVHFDSRRPHCIRNHTEEPATILWCGTMNVFDAAADNQLEEERE